jgi:hypothetical protein
MRDQLPSFRDQAPELNQEERISTRGIGSDSNNAILKHIMPIISNVIDRLEGNRKQDEHERLKDLIQDERLLQRTDLLSKSFETLIDKQNTGVNLLKELLEAIKGRGGAAAGGGIGDATDVLAAAAGGAAAAAARTAATVAARAALTTAAGAAVAGGAVRGAFELADALTPESQRAANPSANTPQNIIGGSLNLKLERDIPPFRRGQTVSFNDMQREFNLGENEAREFIDGLLRSRQVVPVTATTPVPAATPQAPTATPATPSGGVEARNITNVELGMFRERDPEGAAQYDEFVRTRTQELNREFRPSERARNNLAIELERGGHTRRSDTTAILEANEHFRERIAAAGALASQTEVTRDGNVVAERQTPPVATPVPPTAPQAPAATPEPIAPPQASPQNSGELTGTQRQLVERVLADNRLGNDPEAKELAERLVRRIRMTGIYDIDIRLLRDDFNSIRLAQSPIGMIIAGTPVIPGRPFTIQQMQSIAGGIMMNGRNHYPAVVVEQYDRQKSELGEPAGAGPVSPDATSAPAATPGITIRRGREFESDFRATSPAAPSVTSGRTFEQGLVDRPAQPAPAATPESQTTPGVRTGRNFLNPADFGTTPTAPNQQPAPVATPERHSSLDSSIMDALISGFDRSGSETGPRTQGTMYAQAPDQSGVMSDAQPAQPDATRVEEPAPEAPAAAPEQRTTTQQEGARPTNRDLTFGPGVDRRLEQGIASKVGQIESSFGKRLIVTSGFRDPARNARVGGARNSAHTRGNAVDVTFSGNEQDTNKLIEVASSAGIGGIGVYRPGWVHLDTENKRVWGPDFSARSIPQWARRALDAHMTGRREDAQATPAETPAAQMQQQPHAEPVEAAPETQAPQQPDAQPVTEPTGQDGMGGGELMSGTTPGAAATPTAAAPQGGMQVMQASQENAVAERTPSPPAVAPSMSTPAGDASPGTPVPTTQQSSTDPGRVEPEDAAERYARLFNMAA